MKPKSVLNKLEFLAEGLSNIHVKHESYCGGISCTCGMDEKKEKMLELVLEWMRKEKKSIKEAKDEKRKEKEKKECNIF